jgi:transposase-like protein
MNPAPQRRRHRSRAERQRLVEQWKATGLSSRAFADQADVRASSLWRWRRELAKGTAASLVPVVIREEDVAPGEAWAPSSSPQVELVARGGRVLRVFAGCDQALLRAVLGVAEEGAPC